MTRSAWLGVPGGNCRRAPRAPAGPGVLSQGALPGGLPVPGKGSSGADPPLTPMGDRVRFHRPLPVGRGRSKRLYLRLPGSVFSGSHLFSGSHRSGEGSWPVRTSVSGRNCSWLPFKESCAPPSKEYGSSRIGKKISGIRFMELAGTCRREFRPCKHPTICSVAAHPWRSLGQDGGFSAPGSGTSPGICPAEKKPDRRYRA